MALRWSRTQPWGLTLVRLTCTITLRPDMMARVFVDGYAPPGYVCISRCSILVRMVTGRGYRCTTCSLQSLMTVLMVMKDGLMMSTSDIVIVFQWQSLDTLYYFGINYKRMYYEIYSVIRMN